MALIAVGALLFLLISGLLARFLSVENAEREDLVGVLQAEANGDAQAMLNRLSGCRESPNCTAAVQQNAVKLRRPGAVKILTLTSPTAYALTGKTGTTRVAWTVIGHLPVVQCVGVKRTGNALTGVSVKLLSIGPQIPGEADCPSR
jgi:hypothetical protein